MNVTLKRTLIILIAILFFAGCQKGKSDNNAATIDSLKTHMYKSDSTLKINSMVEAFAGLVSDPTQQQEMVDNARAGYANMNIQEIYLVTGATAESNESILGSLIHFNKAMTLDEAKTQLAKDDNFKNQTMDIFMNGNFAFAVSTVNGKRITPESVVTRFQNF